MRFTKKSIIYSIVIIFLVVISVLATEFIDKEILQKSFGGIVALTGVDKSTSISPFTTSKYSLGDEINKWLYVRSDYGNFIGVTTTQATTTNLTVSSLTTCDIKSDNNGNFYCGIDADTGGGSGAAWEEKWTNTLTPTNTGAGIWVTASTTIGSDNMDVYLGSTNQDTFVSSTMKISGALTVYGAIDFLDNSLQWADLGNIPTSTTDQLPVGITNLYWAQSLFDAALAASSTILTEADFAEIFNTNLNGTSTNVTEADFNGLWTTELNNTTTLDLTTFFVNRATTTNIAVINGDNFIQIYNDGTDGVITTNDPSRIIFLESDLLVEAASSTITGKLKITDSATTSGQFSIGAGGSHNNQVLCILDTSGQIGFCLNQPDALGICNCTSF